MLKPDAELFRILFRRNNIVPEQAIFIDNSIKNVEADDVERRDLSARRSAGARLLALGVLRPRSRMIRISCPGPRSGMCSGSAILAVDRTDSFRISGSRAAVHDP